MGLMHFVYTYLAINCQAIFKCPYGTDSLTARPKGAKFKNAVLKAAFAAGSAGYFFQKTRAG